MPLTQKHRSSIYQSFVPILGAEEAEALMSEFRTEDDELATKGFVRAEIAEVRTEIAALRTEMHDMMRQQTVWFSGAMIAGLSLSATIASLI